MFRLCYNILCLCITKERLAVTHGRYGDSLVGENKFLQALVNYKLANGIQPCYMYMSKW